MFVLLCFQKSKNGKYMYFVLDQKQHIAQRHVFCTWNQITESCTCVNNVWLWKPVHILSIFCLWTCTSQKFTTTVSSFLNLKNVCRTRRSYVTQNSVCILHRQRERVILFRFRSQIFVFKRYQLSNPEFWIGLFWWNCKKVAVFKTEFEE